jgi:hypothetical protein
MRYRQIALLAVVCVETTSLTVLFLGVRVEGPLSSAVAFSVLKLFFLNGVRHPTSP